MYKKLTEKEQAYLTPRVNEYGNTVYPNIPRSFIEKVSGGSLNTNPWHDTGGGYHECCLYVYPKGFASWRKRFAHFCSTDKSVDPVYDTMSSGRTYEEAKQSAFRQVIEHFVDSDNGYESGPVSPH